MLVQCLLPLASSKAYTSKPSKKKLVEDQLKMGSSSERERKNKRTERNVILGLL